MKSWWEWISARNVFLNSSQRHCPRDVKWTTTPGGVFLSIDWTGLARMSMFSRFQTVSSASLRPRSFVVQFLTRRCWCGSLQKSIFTRWLTHGYARFPLAALLQFIAFYLFYLRSGSSFQGKCSVIYLYIYYLSPPAAPSLAPDWNVFGKRRVRV